ncbi:hypothetical protein IFO69_04205 [Echinicola sp. CAU 1574]|uniref:Lumazine-binding protein n=1 Tax=Echinicola arenosa TaxID=2774144 RepID=A0ABR9AGF9_9BACT|nr:hypothetical protein [Echinicola arenosa]MBD8487947.1 hypothetical protein [Echinicola arenosa]
MINHWKKIILTLLLIAGFSYWGHAQSFDTDELEVKSVIDAMFKGLEDKDTAMIRAAFSEGARLETISQRLEEVSTRSQSVEDFVSGIGKVPAEMELEERLLDYKIKIDGPMAAVWTPYAFYVNGELSHCGVNSFQLVKFTKGWKIVYIIDTRRKEGC